MGFRVQRCLSLLLGLALLAVAGCGGGSAGNGAGAGATPTLVSIQITPAAASIAKSTTQQYAATGTFSDNTTQDLTATATWTSATTGVATITSAGLATGMAPGADNITATSGAVTSNTATLTVTAAALVSLQVTPASASIAKGTTQQYAASGTFNDNSMQDLTGSVAWGSSDTGVATISTAGVANGATAGMVTITATFGSKNGSATLTVTPAQLTSIAVIPPAPSIALGTTQLFKATGTYSDLTMPDLTAKVSWTATALSGGTSNISSVGLATGTGVGTVTITATSGGISGTATLTVTAATLVSIQVNPATATVLTGLTHQYSATGTYSDQTTQDLTASASWTATPLSGGSANITSGGLATGTAGGTVTVVAMSQGISSNGATLTVSDTLTALVGNLRDLGVTHSGFVIGTAGGGAGGVSAVEVSLDGVSSYAAATGTNTWSFKLPTGTNTWKDGSAHTINVRARDASNNLSPVVTLNVRKGVNQDVNGDGYADVVMGAPGFSSPTVIGAVYVFHGSATGVRSGTYATANTVLTGPTGTGFGICVALGDVNGDGYADVVVGAPYANNYAGAVYVFHGSGTGVASRNLNSGGTADTALTGPALTYFGVSMALGDVNGDGYADLVVGANNYDGAVYIFRGSATGVASGTSGSAMTTLTGATSYLGFGKSVALGDVNGDGYLDLAVGGWGYNATAGQAFVFKGTATGIASGTSSSAMTTLTGFAVASGAFGVSVALGDVNGDGYADLAVGVNTFSATTVGAAYVFHGSSTGVASQNLNSNGTANTTLTGAAGSAFGDAVTLADVNGDGYADVTVGAAYASNFAGASYVFHGSSAGVANMAYASANTVLTGIANSIFGLSVALGDVKGAGYADAIGARLADDPARAACRFEPTSGSRATGSNFGTSVAVGDG